MQYEFTEEDRLAVLRLLNEGDTSVFNSDAVNRLLIIHDALNRKMLSALRGSRKENAQLERRMSRFEKREETLCLEGSFDCRGLDILDVAHCLLFCLQQASSSAGIRCQLTFPKFMYLLYDVYARYMADTKCRLTVEIPQYYGYVEKETGKRVDIGPIFFRAKDMVQQALARRIQEPRSAYDKVFSLDQQAAGICWGVAKKYCSLSENALYQWLRNSEPVRDAMPENNGGKFSKEFSDALIYKWKKDQITESEKRNA